MSTETPNTLAFQDLNLNADIVKSLARLGYETPTPIQAQSIPVILDGRDILGQAQTGTGKTAAFALPLLSMIDVNLNKPQVLVLAPTRELAIQVAEAFQQYAQHLDGFHVLPIYGGADYRGQLRQLKSGVHVVVGTPGRVMDHMNRGTLNLDHLTSLVLDEADEMLRMGFIDDVEWILEQTPEDRQISLFSATMPPAIKRIAERYLNNPVHITIKANVRTAETIQQSYCVVNGHEKIDTLTRILEVKEFDGIVIFVRTKNATTEVADKLLARGFMAAPLNGDVRQSDRERTVNQFKAGKLDILVATDVAARGLDVERVSHVINYDIPHDSEAYVHRIGRTGRAGRSGEAILFVAPKERKLLKMIEQTTRQKLEPFAFPTTHEVNEQRIERFKQRITEALSEDSDQDLEPLTKILSAYVQETGASELKVAAALVSMLYAENPLLIEEKSLKISSFHDEREPFRKEKSRDSSFREDRFRDRREGSSRRDSNGRDGRDGRDWDNSRKPMRDDKKVVPAPRAGLERFRIELGHAQQIRPGQIVGAIVNETGLDKEMIGYIDIFNDYSTVDLPVDMPKDMTQTIRDLRINGRKMGLLRHASEGQEAVFAGEKRSSEAFVSPRKPRERDLRERDSRSSDSRAGDSRDRDYREKSGATQGVISFSEKQSKAHKSGKPKSFDKKVKSDRPVRKKRA